MSDDLALRDLTAMEALFVHHYVELHNATEAARRAGYSGGRHLKRTAYTIRHRPHVAAAIKAREEGIADALGITRFWLMSKLRDVIVAGLERKPATYQGGIVRTPCRGDACPDGEDPCGGDGHVVYEAANLAAAHAAVRTAMQHRGMLDERVQVDVDVVRYVIDGIDPASLQ